jgi:cytochrome b561
MIHPALVAHGHVAALLAGFIPLHTLAEFYHKFVVKDTSLRRMLFGGRRSDIAAAGKKCRRRRNGAA